MDNKQKYQKYKTKYLYLKNQVGGYTMSSDAIPTDRTGLYLTIPFDAKLKDTLIDKVLIECNIPYLSKNHSAEGGFELPLTQEWKLANLRNKDLLNYHNARQLRFVEESGVITKLRFKDAINYWSDIELDKLNNCITSAIQTLKINKEDKGTCTGSDTCSDMFSPSSPFGPQGNSPFGPSVNSPFVPQQAPIIVGQIYYFQRGVPIENSVEFVVRVINMAQASLLLKGLDQEYSQGGFQLPHNDFSKKMLNLNPFAQHIIARQLVFVINNNVIIGLRHKDNIVNWQSNEITELLNICNNEISRMYIPIIPVVPLANSAFVPSSYINSLNSASVEEFDDVNFTRFKQYKIKFNKPIDIKFKDKLIKKVLSKAEDKKLLKYIKKSDSPNGGFYLPLTRSWLKYSKNLKIRELIFMIKDDKITGLRCADDITLWTNDEVNKLLDIIYAVNRKLSKK